MAATKKVRLAGGFDRDIKPDPDGEAICTVKVGEVVEVSSPLADALLEQGDVWVSVDVKSAPVGAEKVEG